MGEFSDRVFEIVQKVPYGKVASYGQIATLMGRPRSGRYVGYALKNIPEHLDDVIPAHRIMRADGSLAEGFGGGRPGLQRSLLEAEGVGFVYDGRVDMAHFQWDGCMEDEPAGPPEDFDWAAEMGEC